MKRTVAVLAAVATLASTYAMAQGRVPFPVKARQGAMATMAMSLGVMGKMAKGEMAYDAAAAQAAANGLAGVAMIDPAMMWAEGTADGTRSLPAVWDNADGFATAWAAYVTAAEAAAANAGNGQEALGPLLGALGGSCKGCHDTFRAPQ